LTILFFLLSCFFLVHSADWFDDPFYYPVAVQYISSGQDGLTEGEVVTIPFNKGNPYIPRPPGHLSLMLVANNPIQICIQENFFVSGNLTACNPEGYFLFSNGSVSQTPEFDMELDMDPSAVFNGNNFAQEAAPSFMNVSNTTLRGDVPYFISIRFVNSSLADNNNNTFFNLMLSYPDTSCAPDEVGIPEFDDVFRGCKLTKNTPGQNGVSNYTIDKNDKIFIPIKITNISTYLLNVNAHIISPPSSGHFPADTGNNITLYLRRDNSPNDILYDAISQYIPASQTYVVEFENPIPGTWYLAVVNNLNSSVSVGLSYEAPFCQTIEKFGPNCNNTYTNITGWYNMTSFKATGDLQYFAYYNETLQIGVGYEEVDQPAPALYASLFNWPTNQSNGYMAGGPSMGSAVNFLDVQLPNISSNWFIAIQAEAGTEFYIWIGMVCPNNCEGEDFGTSGNNTHGICNPQSGLCSCEKHYKNLSCTPSGLAVVWIVLIVIACAIILAIAVGVPVACYLRNRRRARYERV